MTGAGEDAVDQFVMHGRGCPPGGEIVHAFARSRNAVFDIKDATGSGPDMREGVDDQHVVAGPIETEGPRSAKAIKKPRF